MQGHFIVLDGPDGSGTTFHSKALCDRLQAEGHDVLFTAEPSDGPIGGFIRKVLGGEGMTADALQLLFTADRAWHVHHVIEPALARGMTVVCDRFVSSTIAYGTALELDEAWLKELNKNFIHPDLLFIALPPFAVCRERLAHRQVRDSLESDTLQEKVHMAYCALAAKDAAIAVVDTSGEKEKVAEEMWMIAQASLASVPAFKRL